MTYDPKLPGCFGERDLLFANHPLDEQRAFDWLNELRKQQTGWTEVRRQIQEFLTERGAGKDHIRKQIERASKLLKPWLFD